MKERNTTLLGVSDEESPAIRWRCMLGTMGDMGTLLVGSQPLRLASETLSSQVPPGSSPAVWDGGRAYIQMQH